MALLEGRRRPWALPGRRTGGAAPVFLRKRPICSSWSGSPRGGRQAGSHLEDTRAAQEHGGRAGAIFARFLLPGQACVHDSGARVLATAAQGTPPDRLALEASGAYACNATALCVFAFFKSCLRTWWPLTEVLPFGTETGLGTAPTTGSP